MPTIEPGGLTHADLKQCFFKAEPVELANSWRAPVEASHQTVLDLIAKGETVYGLNTGFGLLANKKISESDLATLQLNLVRSHCAGTGPLLDDEVVRLILLLKMASLARGFSGVRPVVVEQLQTLLQNDLLPCIPSKGSVGASGDLAPLAHMSLALIGEGNVRVKDQVVPADQALADAGIEPLELGPKEGLALLNGTQVSTALALAGLYRAERVFLAAIATGSLSVDAAFGSDTPFDRRVHEIRNQQGQIDCAAMYRDILENSQIRESHIDCDRVQDPYSLRCQPQVMGACLDSLRHASNILLREANAVSDNPLVFCEDGSMLSGGNFHAEPVAIAADLIAIAIAEIGSLSERRMSLLIDRHLSNLPSFLVKEGGINSGFMIPQVTSAALTSENKHLASAVSVDSLPTSANQEDHVSMATYAANRLLTMTDNAASIIAIEMLAAAQGIDFRAPLKTSAKLQRLHQLIRKQAEHLAADRTFHEDIERVATHVVLGESLTELVPASGIA